MAEYSRPQGFRFKFSGMNLRSQPDALPPNKYGMAKNIRALSDNSIQERPGYTKLFQTAGKQRITDIRAYTAINTDNTPRYLVRDATQKIYLDTGTLIATLSGGSSSGASMIPFRPASSPQPWMYIANGADSQKISAPDGSNNCVVQKVGIAEPATACEASPNALKFNEVNIDAANWANTGTAGALSNANISAAVNTVQGNPLSDPVVSTRYSAPVGVSNLWDIGMVVDISTHGGLHGIIQDYVQPTPASAGLTVAAIRYDSGTTGLCTVVISAVEVGKTGFVSGFRRGAIVEFDTGGAHDELCFIRSVSVSADGGTVSFRTSTANTQTTGRTVEIRRTIVVDDLSPTFSLDNIGVNMLNSTVTAGDGKISSTLASSPFVTSWGVGGAGLPRQDDYIHLTFQVASPSYLTGIKIIFNVGPQSPPDYVSNIFYYQLSGAPLTAITNAGSVFELSIPITSLIDAGGGINLSACNGIQVIFTVSNSTSCGFGAFTISGGGLPDVGDAGAPYRYRVVPRSSTTGAKGNASPDMRYGVSPRRQSVTIDLPSAAYDSQIDTFDIYRYGGSVLAFRYIGSTPSSNSTFVDNVFDDTALAGALMETDNFEPFPSVDVPFTAPGGSTLTIVGTYVKLQVASAGDWPANIARWLPGTLIGTGGFTLRSRPTSISATVYLFETVEELGTGTYFGSFVVSEPLIARQCLPYLWGPDANGVMFGVGDPLRPGTVYWTKPFNPDSAPDTNTLELTPPSEPLLGGELRDGLAYVYSAMRWWALYPNFGGTTAYTPVERPVGKPPTTPFGSVTDGSIIWFWAKDGICATDGGPGTTITDEDLYPLFPHDGIPGDDVTRNGETITAPGYQYIASFRLARVGCYLYADYEDSSGANRQTLVYDLRTKAWSVDKYADIITVHYAPEQTEGTITSGSPAEFPLLLMGDLFGNVYKQTEPANDNGADIPVMLSTFEWDGGDLRAPVLFGDGYVDLIPHNDVSVVPVSQQVQILTPQIIPAAIIRKFVTVTVGGETLRKFLGMLFRWTANTISNLKTTLYIWQYSLLPQPEITVDRWSDFDAAGVQSAKYFRGFVLTADTFGIKKQIGINNGDNGDVVPFTINHNGEQEIGYAFAAPFVAHMVRIIPFDSVQWRTFGVRWIFDEWPELTQESSAWMDMGTKGSKYFRGGTVCIDTNGKEVEIKIKSSDDGNTRSLGTFNTLPAQKTEVAFAIAAPNVAPGPFIGHEFQFIPSGPCRIWWGEAVFHVDPYPEITREWTPVLQISGADDKYIRAIRLVIDTGGKPVNFQVLANNAVGQIIGPLTTTGKEIIPWAFNPPFIAHTAQLYPDAPVRIFTPECKWDSEIYPELIPEWTPIMEYNGPDNKYFRGVRLTCDSAGKVVTFSTKIDGGVAGPTIGPLVFTGKQTLSWAFRPPFIAHNVQIIPNIACRIWLDLSLFDMDPYPELIAEYTSILELGGPDAKYIQGLKLTADSGNVPAQCQVLYDGGQAGPLLDTRTWNGKSVQVFSFPPFVAHSVQLEPLTPLRIWVPESEWVWEPTPELAVEWGPTQWTAHGMTGYHHLYRIETAYAATSPVLLVIESFDGLAPQPIILPSTGGVYQKILTTLTANKGQLYRYSATSAAKFQIWLNDWKVYVGQWGRTDAYTLYQNLGGAYGDKARI